MALPAQLPRRHARESPCPFCRGAFAHSHTCNAMTQLAFIRKRLKPLSSPPPQQATNGESFATPHQLSAHLRSKHHSSMAEGALGVDNDIREPSRSTSTNASSDPGPQGQQQMMELLQQVATLAIRTDREAQLLRSQDTMVFFMSANSESILKQLFLTAAEWHQRKNETGEGIPLPVHLIQTLVGELHTRVLKIASADKESALIKSTIKPFLPDLTWPFYHWDQKLQKLTVSKKKLTMAQVAKVGEGLVECFREPGATMYFFSMRTQAVAKSLQTAAWKLQASLRRTTKSGTFSWPRTAAACGDKRHSFSSIEIGESNPSEDAPGAGQGKRSSMPFAFSCSRTPATCAI